MTKERFITLIDKYLSGTATNSEKQLVEEYLTRLEANENTKLNSEQEQQVKEAMWRQIQQRTIRKPEEVIRLSWYRSKGFFRVAVAASIIMVIVWGMLFLTDSGPARPPVVVKDKIKRESTFIVHREVNTTGRGKRIQLPDGSLVVLADKSEITYREPFVNSRNVALIGKAFWKVARDTIKPFTVISGEISTTVLGTEFTVTAFKNAARIIVRLYEGKVVVRSVDAGNKRMKHAVYLLPGQELVYGSDSVKVTSFRLKQHAAPERILDSELSGDNPSIPENTKSSYFMFNNQSLAEVLDNLAALYDVKIVYDKTDLQNIYFTGKYNRIDSSEPILKRIGTLNNLTITKKDNAFIISK